MHQQFGFQKKVKIIAAYGPSEQGGARQLGTYSMDTTRPEVASQLPRVNANVVFVQSCCMTKKELM
jgi:hypothetical protein